MSSVSIRMILFPHIRPILSPMLFQLSFIIYTSIKHFSVHNAAPLSLSTCTQPLIIPSHLYTQHCLSLPQYTECITFTENVDQNLNLFVT